MESTTRFAMQTVESIEAQYEIFAQCNTAHLSSSNIFGINLSQNSSHPDFKIYIPDVKTNHWLYAAIKKLHMDGYSEVSTSSREPSITRVAYRLYNRTDNNINQLLNTIKRKRPWLNTSIDEINALAELPINSSYNHRRSALYFVGANSGSSFGEVIKFYFLTRECPYVDRIEYQSRRNDPAFISELKRMADFQRLLSLAVPLLDNKIHLWFVAVDVAVRGVQKRKIYLDGTDNKTLHKLIDRLEDEADKHGLAASIRLLIEWQESFHPKLHLHGFALCEKTTGELSVNLYYREPDVSCARLEKG